MPSSPARYQQIADVITRQLETGERPVGSTLPSVADLAKDFGVSQMTVKAALSVLVDRGLVATARGVRAVVLDTPQPQQGDELSKRLARIEDDVATLKRRTERLEHGSKSTTHSDAQP